MFQTRTARWLAGTALLCVALLAGAWFVLVAPKRSEAAALRDANSSAQQRNDSLEIQIAQLRAQFVKLPERQAELADVLQQLPPTADMPKLVRDLDALARANGVTLKSVTPGAATYLTLPAGTAAAPASAGAAAQPAAAGAGGTTGTTGTTAAGAGVLGQVAQIPLVLLVHGDYYAQLSFLKQLQHSMSRAILLTGLQFTGGQTGPGPAGQVDLTLSGAVFALPGSAAALAATTAARASAGTTGSAGTTSTTSLGSTASARPREY